MSGKTKAWEEEPGVVSSSRLIGLVWLAMVAGAAVGAFWMATRGAGATDPRFDRWMSAAKWLAGTGPVALGYYFSNVVTTNTRFARDDSSDGEG